MITLYAFGPAFGQPDASPFVIKAHVLLKMSGQPYEVNTQGFNKAPKGKLPYINDAGTVVADSTFIRWHLEKQYGIDFDQGLTPEQRGVAWATEKLMEDNLYWIVLYWRWMKEANFEVGAAVYFKAIPAPLRGVIKALVKRGMRKSLRAQGMGRHTEAEMLAIGRRGVDALAALLGDKPYLMGDQPCSTDAMLFACVTSGTCAAFDTPMRQVIESHPNLVAYRTRMQQRYFAQDAAAMPMAKAA